MLDRNGPIHKTRIVYNSHVDTVTTDTNIYCSRPTWTLWLARANALHTTCDTRSYAQVLKQGKAIVRTEQLNEKVQPVEKQQFTASFSQTKNVTKTQKSSQKCDNIQDTRVLTQTVSQRHLIPTSNRFQILQYDLQGVEHDWDSLDNAFVGNKNKTGKSLGQSHTHVKQQNGWQDAAFKTLDTCPVQDTFNFKGNKNGNGSKLGHMHTTKANKDNLMSDKQNKVGKSLENDQLENDMSFNNAGLTGAMHWDYLDKDLVGNKNKTGKSLGQSHTRVKQQDGCQNTAFTTLPECPVQIPLNFKASTNGNYSKLGQFHKTKAITQELMSDKQSHDYQVGSQSVDKNKNELTVNPASIHFLGNKNGNGTKLGSQADQHITGETYIPRLMQTEVTDFSDPTVTEVQQLSCKHARQIPSEVYQSRFQSIDHKNCLYQNDKNFGFIPFNDLMVYTGPDIIWGTVPDIIEAHAKVRKSRLPNFMNVRIPLKTQLKVHCWKKYLHEYWDQQLVDLIQFGFPLDFDRQVVLQSTEVNHSSALKYPDHVSNYIQEELQYGAVLGPFKQFPFHCHVSPFLTRDKPNSNNRRVILDLSFPPGNSVNAGVSKDKYLGSYFELKYPSVDHIVESLKQLGPTALLYKIDISRAFRHIRIDPGDLDLLGLRHDDYFIDGTLPFGFRHGSAFFQRCTDAVRYIMKDRFNFPNLYNYIDDLIYTGLPADIYQSFDTLKALLQELGLEISVAKLIQPTTVAVCLGIQINTITRTLSIPKDKLKEITEICLAYVSKNKVTKSQFQSLLGSLLYITKCVKPARFFLNRMLSLLRQHTSTNYVILDQEFQKDLNWFNTFLCQYNGITFYDKVLPQDRVFLDASLQGLGGVFKNMVYSLQIPKGFNNYTIVHLEILNIVVALKVWGPFWKNHAIEVKCDNMAVVEVLNTGRARDRMLATSARNIWLLTSMYNIDLVVTHIPGAKNVVADLLSRWHHTDHDISKLNSLVPDHQWLPVHINHTILNTNI